MALVGMNLLLASRWRRGNCQVGRRKESCLSKKSLQKVSSFAPYISYDLGVKRVIWLLRHLHSRLNCWDSSQKTAKKNEWERAVRARFKVFLYSNITIKSWQIGFSLFKIVLAWHKHLSPMMISKKQASSIWFLCFQRPVPLLTESFHRAHNDRSSIFSIWGEFSISRTTS